VTALPKREREDYLIRLGKEFAFAGAAIPEKLEVDGREVRLRAYVFGLAKRKGRLTADEQAEIDATAALLRRRRQEIAGRMAADVLTREEAESLFQTARGIDRALDTLYRLHEPKASVAEEARKARLQDGRRWLGLVKKVYARDQGERRL